MKNSEQLNELATALSLAQAKIQTAKKDAVNPFFKSSYATLGSIWASVREPLTDNGLSVTQIPVEDERGIKLMTVLLHASGQYISSEMYLRPTKDDMQAMGSALTYARRYALAAMVGAISDEDDDGNEASKPQQNKRAMYKARLKEYQTIINKRDKTNITFDDSWLDSAPLEELEDKGKELKKLIDGA